VKTELSLLTALFLAISTDSQAALRPASELLTCSIDYHDPQGRWQTGTFKITDVSRQPDGTIGRRTILHIDNAKGRFSVETHVDGRVVLATFSGDHLNEVRLGGKTEFSAEEARRFQLTAPQLLTRRNFFLYLLGLPMKLRDPGTHLDPVARETVFQGSTVYELRVTYEQGVGNDTWYFYLSPETCALVGHRFHHDDHARDGEYTFVSGEVAGQGLRLPRVKKWHRNQDDEWFITHTVESIDPR